jgi:uncharacterized sulfatase
MKRWIVLALVAVVAAWWLWPRHLPRIGHGDAELDLSVYSDAARDAVRVADVVARRPDAPARPPNVVVIMADDLGYGDLGAYGNTLLATPRIDALARQGARFTDFYASHSNCSPSRAGLLTGRYPLRSGINFPIQRGDDDLQRSLARRVGRWSGKLGAADLVQAGESAIAGLPASEVTLAEALRLAGYATGLVGKWHLGDFTTYPEYHPRRHGFDAFAGFPGSNDEFPYCYWKDETQVEENLGLRQGGVTATLTDEAVRFIDANRARPFFLYFAEKNVHTPLVPSPQFAGGSPGGPYGDSVAELDWSVGQIVDALAARNLLDQTLLIFTSDNGPWHLGSPGALRGRKGQPMEGGQRVPAIASWPGHIPAGRVIAAPAMNFDLFPTILRLAGLELPRDRVIDGRDLWPLLSGASDADPHEALYFFNANVIDGARGGRWKYYRWVNLYTWPVPLDKPNTLAGRYAHGYTYTDPQTGDTAQLVTHAPLLFDVVADRNESYNVAAAHPDEAARLHDAIEAWERDFFANPRGWRATE